MIYLMTTFPPSLRQVALLALIMLAPLGIAIAAVARSASTPTLVILGIVVMVFVVILYFVTARHTVEVRRERLIVRHSLYTLAIDRSAISAAKVQQVRTNNCLGLAVRTNGIAAFGYLSGWFRTGDSSRTFCAVSQGPLYLVTLEGNPDCRYLALSADAGIAAKIEAWAAGGKD